MPNPISPSPSKSASLTEEPNNDSLDFMDCIHASKELSITPSESTYLRVQSS